MKPQIVVLLTFAGVALFVGFAAWVFISAEVRDDAIRTVRRGEERYERRAVLDGDESLAAAADPPSADIPSADISSADISSADVSRERTLLVRDAVLPPNFRNRFPDTDIVVRMTGNRIGRLAILDDDAELDAETLDLAEESAVAYARFGEYEQAWLESQLRIGKYESFETAEAAQARFDAMQGESPGSPWQRELDDGTFVVLDATLLQSDKEYRRRKEAIEIAQRALDARRKLESMFFVYEPDHSFR